MMGKDQNTRGTVTATVLKWIGATTAVISLVLGGRQIVLMIQDNVARKNRSAELEIAAQRLASSAQYEKAWESMSKAVELNSDYREAKVNLAMSWLRDIRTGGRTFTELVDKVMPTLYGAIDTTRKEYSATIQAHIGWASFLLSREDPSVRVEEHFREALTLDPPNPYAHAMYGFWILYPGKGGGSLSEANRHFAEALKGGRETDYIRYLMFSAYHNCPTPECKAQVIKLANDIRKNRESLKLSDRERIVAEAYYTYRDRIMDEVAKLITQEEHVATLEFLSEGIDKSTKPYIEQALARISKANR